MRQIFGIILVLVSGCTAGPRVTMKPPIVEPRPPAAIPVGTVPALTKSETQMIAADPLPVYRSPKVTKVVVAPYINAKGEAFPESYKYVFADEGGWNIDALRNPERAYVPSENAERPLNAPGVLWGSLSPGQIQPSNKSEDRSARGLLNLSDVFVTGFLNKGDEPKVVEEAVRKFGPNHNRVPVFDPDLGWLVVPRAAFQTSVGDHGPR